MSTAEQKSVRPIHRALPPVSALPGSLPQVLGISTNCSIQLCLSTINGELSAAHVFVVIPTDEIVQLPTLLMSKRSQ